MQVSSSTQKYLTHYAEQETLHATVLFKKITPLVFEQCLCLPFYKEPLEHLVRMVEFAEQQAGSLVVLVINQPDDIHHNCDNNIACHNWLKQHKNKCAQQHNLTLYTLQNNSAILLVDRYSAQLTIPKKYGVGLARKIAADIALTLIAQHYIKSPWVFSSDADAILPAQYFTAVTRSSYNNATDIAALLLPFTHVSGDPLDNRKSNNKPALEHATKIYEQRLQGYVDGLKTANSPYAFHTVGSTLCIHAQHYAIVRGFPKRSAGEDFYILNKLRKSAQIISLASPVIHIISRVSDRTPFGTGPAVSSLLEQSDLKKAEIFYHPHLFQLLKTTLHWLLVLSEKIYTNSRQTQGIQWHTHLYASTKNNHHAALIESALLAINFEKGLQHCLKQTSTAEQFNTQMFFWFDAFRTMKWLHHLRDNNTAFKNISLETPNNDSL